MWVRSVNRCVGTGIVDNSLCLSEIFVPFDMTVTEDDIVAAAVPVPLAVSEIVTVVWHVQCVRPNGHHGSSSSSITTHCAGHLTAERGTPSIATPMGNCPTLWFGR